MTKTIITIGVSVEAPVEKIWECWTQPQHIVKWNTASNDWHTTHATNDLRVGSKFNTRMEAKDGSFGFDFWGIYDEIQVNNRIAYTLGDDRKVEVIFRSEGNLTQITQIFEAETENSVELQQGGWQAILNNFKAYAEQQTPTT